MKTILNTNRFATTLLSLSLFILFSCASSNPGLLEQDDSYFSSSDLKKEREAAAQAKAEAGKIQNTQSSAQTANAVPDYVNPAYKASGKAGNRIYSDNEAINHTQNLGFQNFSSPYYSNSYFGGYSWVPGPFSSFGPSFSLCYPGWYGSGWGTSLILGTRPYNPWAMNMGNGFGFNSFGYNSFGFNSFGYNNFDPFWGSPMGYYGYNPYSYFVYSPYQSFNNFNGWGNSFAPPVSVNDPTVTTGRPIRTNLPMSGMTGTPGNSSAGTRSGNAPSGGREPGGDRQTGGTPVVVNPANPGRQVAEPGSPNPGSWRQTNGSQAVGQTPDQPWRGSAINTDPSTSNNPGTRNDNPATPQPDQSDFWRRSSTPSNNTFRTNSNNSGWGNSSFGGSGSGSNSSGASGGRSGGGGPTGGRRR